MAALRQVGVLDIASGGQAHPLQRFPNKGQVGVDVMPGCYLDKLYPVRVSLGILPAGGDGHDLIPCWEACDTNLERDMQNATLSPDDECLLQQR
jgi:hypothetical protein